ncbi:MAG: hypothetical protein V4618_12705 [Pseudomonadota bacterium]
MNMMTAQWMEQAEAASVEMLMQMNIHISEQPRPMPPAWMIAPSFRGAEQVSARADAVATAATASLSATEPYRSLREVPRVF